jgi:hypothetical protein
MGWPVPLPPLAVAAKLREARRGALSSSPRPKTEPLAKKISGKDLQKPAKNTMSRGKLPIFNKAKEIDLS